MSKPQFILAVSSAFDAKAELKPGMNMISLDQFIASAQSLLAIRERDHLEQDPNYRQIIPYVILAKKVGGSSHKFVPYVRTSQSGEERLRGNISIGFGGHVDLADVAQENSVINLAQTIGMAVGRELAEEVKIFSESQDMPVFDNGLLIDDSNEVGKVHLGVVLTVVLREDAVITSNEDALEVLAPMTARELLESGLPLENWSRIFLESVVSTDGDQLNLPEQEVVA